MRWIDAETCSLPIGKRRRIAGAEPNSIMPLLVICSRLTKRNTYSAAGTITQHRSKLSLQRGAKFREGMGNGLRLRISRNDGHKPKTRKENHIMKNRKNTLTYIVAAARHPRDLGEFVAAAAAPLPQNYTGSLRTASSSPVPVSPESAGVTRLMERGFCTSIA